jgi:hypothetical protein
VEFSTQIQATAPELLRCSDFQIWDRHSSPEP